jgi:hypothetical protein
MNGDGYLDFAITSESFSDGTPPELYNLVPYYYSNDAQTTLTVSSPPTLPAGTYSLNIGYPGTQVYQSNTGSTPLYITQASPTGNLTVSPTGSPYPFGTSLTFTATVTGVAGGAAPSGTVTFYDGEGTLGSVNLTSGGGLTSTATLATSQPPRWCSPAPYLETSPRPRVLQPQPAPW